ncbi:O-antigen ligase domain-containing protein [Micromonospora sp. NPDC049679]|uniref:O-antigen ligase family protein n=1 Tax=Micromonospora sp. NPDC049679 TaxID=3155920 RepID=UPI0033FEA47D
MADLPAARLPGPDRLPLLPLWPLFLMFGLTPLWWATGTFYLGWPLLGGLLFALMATRGRVPLPPATTFWLLFLAMVVLSGIRLATVSALLTFGLRLSFYVTALIVCAYVYSAARERDVLTPVLAPLGAFWLGIVLLGWLGVLAPRFAMTTPMELILPGGITSNPFIRDMIHLHTAEYSLRSLNPIYRPAAPFAYTNNYGSAYALVLPCVVAFVMLRRRGLFRTVLLISLPLSLPPAFLTLNRGMFLSVGVGLAFLGVRATLRGNVRVAASIVGVVVLGALAMVFIPIGELINQRVSSSDTNTDRLSLYVEVLRRVGQSPLLGFGAPANVDTVSAEAPIGTQGQLWMVLFSHGVPALLFFIGWFVAAFVICLKASSPAGQWLAVVPLIGLVQLPFYGMVNQNLTAAFFAVGFALALSERERALARWRPPLPRNRRRSAPVPASGLLLSRGGAA